MNFNETVGRLQASLSAAGRHLGPIAQDMREEAARLVEASPLNPVEYGPALTAASVASQKAAETATLRSDLSLLAIRRVEWRVRERLEGKAAAGPAPVLPADLVARVDGLVALAARLEACGSLEDRIGLLSAPLDAPRRRPR